MNYQICLRGVAAVGLWLAHLLYAPGAMGQNGIFADFTTSLGNFTCQLDYVNAPKAVANFIGLASGQRPWLDLPTGQVRTEPYFDGLIFHRVISGFMIQSGSPNAEGTDGPGYAFPDEFSPALRFSGAGVLAMANSGPKSNGSQFFITVAPASWLNDVHTIFGWLVSGTNVVTAMSEVATDASDKPLTNVVVQKVTIRRVGAAADAFNVNGQNLPMVTSPGLRLTNSPAQVSLSFTNRQFADNRLYFSTNLNAWSADSLGIEVTSAGTNVVYRAKNSTQGFYRIAQVQYPSSTFAPKSVYSRTVVLNFSDGGGVITVAFDASGGGSYTYPPGSAGSVTSYEWSQEPYRGYLWPIYYSELVPMTLRLDFASNTAGSFEGTAYTSPFSTSVSGTFTLSP